MEETHAVTMPIKDDQARSQIIFARRAIDWAIVTCERPSR